jgi:CHAD domain-containing protein
MSADERGAVPTEIDKFASAQAVRLLGKLAFEVRHSAKHPNQEAIHDLRVSIRRFSQCLKEFHKFFQKRKAKGMLKQLRDVMSLAAEMRNRDIAIELIGAQGDPAKAEILANLRQEREAAKRELTRALVQWRRRDFSRKWRPWLAV